MRRVNFDPVRTQGLGMYGGSNVRLFQLLEILTSHGASVGSPSLDQARRTQGRIFRKRVIVGDLAHGAGMPDLLKKSGALAVDGVDDALPRRQRGRLHSPHHRHPIGGRMIGRSRLADDQTRAARRTAAHVLDHPGRGRSVVHEAPLHAGHHEPVPQRQIADPQRREQDFEFAWRHGPLRRCNGPSSPAYRIISRPSRADPRTENSNDASCRRCIVAGPGHHCECTPERTGRRPRLRSRLSQIDTRPLPGGRAETRPGFGRTGSQLPPHRKRNQRASGQGHLAKRDGAWKSAAPLRRSRQRSGCVLRNRRRERQGGHRDGPPASRESDGYRGRVVHRARGRSRAARLQSAELAECRRARCDTTSGAEPNGSEASAARDDDRYRQQLLRRDHLARWHRRTRAPRLQPI